MTGSRGALVRLTRSRSMSPRRAPERCGRLTSGREAPRSITDDQLSPVRASQESATHPDTFSIPARN